MIKTIIFDFGGVISIGKFFPVVSGALGEKFGLDEKTIREKMYANETEYMSGRESTFTFWEKTCKELGIPYHTVETPEEMSNIIDDWLTAVERKGNRNE